MEITFSQADELRGIKEEADALRAQYPQITQANTTEKQANEIIATAGALKECFDNLWRAIQSEKEAKLQADPNNGAAIEGAFWAVLDEVNVVHILDALIREGSRLTRPYLLTEEGMREGEARADELLLHVDDNPNWGVGWLYTEPAEDWEDPDPDDPGPSGWKRAPLAERPTPGNYE